MNGAHGPPLACTLTADGLRRRVLEIETLTRDALMSCERADLKVTLRYVADAGDRVRQMVAQEQVCCAFLTFRVQQLPSSVEVTITAPERAREIVGELFAVFTGGRLQATHEPRASARVRRLKGPVQGAPATSLVATITCPLCHHAAEEEMPLDRCLYFYECLGCDVVLRPAPGDCCVFCSYADLPCPSKQNEGCCH